MEILLKSAPLLKQLEELLVSTLLPEEVQRQYSEGAVSKSALQPYVESLARTSNAYNQAASGGSLAQPIRSALDGEAYALYYGLVNSAKIHSLLTRVNLPEKLSILDFGSGPGTASLTARLLSSDISSVTCVESSTPMINLAERLHKVLSVNAPNTDLTFASSLTKIPTKRFNLVMAANVFAELPTESALQTFEQLLHQLDEDGILIVLEPGQPTHTRALMKIRDEALHSNKNLNILFPCCRTAACPMLQSSATDWCHGTLTWSQPQMVRQFDHLLGFNKHRLKYSAMIFQKSTAPTTSVAPHNYTVIIPAEKTRRGIEVTLCGEDFYGNIIVPKKVRNVLTKPLEKASLFQIVTLSQPANTVLSEDTQVTIKK